MATNGDIRLGKQQLLIDNILAGDTEAFGKLVTAHQATVRAYLAVRLRNPHDVDDLSQETFLVAFQHLDRFDPTRPMGPWLRGIAEKLLLNHWRKKKPTVLGPQEELEQLIDRTIEERLQTQPASRLMNALAECLGTLTRKARTLVRWRYEDGLNINEIRRRLDCGHSAVTMTLFRAREQVASCIRRRLGEENPLG